MRVALLALHFAEYACRLALGLAEKHDVQLHLSLPNADRELTPALKAEVARWTQPRFHPRPHRRWILPHGARLAAEIAAFRPEIIHAQEAAPWTVGLAALLSRRSHRKFLLTVHDPEPHSGHDARARARTWIANTWLRRYADGILVHGPSLVPRIERLEPKAIGRVFAVNHGVLGGFQSSDGARDERFFLFFGRIEAYKGLGVLLDAADLLERRAIDYSLRIVGAGTDLERHRARIAATRHVTLEQRFVPSTEVSALFAGAMAIVVPYLEASQSGIIAHGFAAHKPMIVTDVGAFRDIVRPEVNGLLVPPGDAEALAEAMARIASDPRLRRRLTAGAAATANGDLSWKRIAEETSDIYRKVSTGERPWPG